MSCVLFDVHVQAFGQWSFAMINRSASSTTFFLHFSYKSANRVRVDLFFRTKFMLPVDLVDKHGQLSSSYCLQLLMQHNVISNTEDIIDRALELAERSVWSPVGLVRLSVTRSSVCVSCHRRRMNCTRLLSYIVQMPPDRIRSTMNEVKANESILSVCRPVVERVRFMTDNAARSRETSRISSMFAPSYSSSRVIVPDVSKSITPIQTSSNNSLTNSNKTISKSLSSMSVPQPVEMDVKRCRSLLISSSTSSRLSRYVLEKRHVHNSPIMFIYKNVRLTICKNSSVGLVLSLIVSCLFVY
jgi:hypothetical protein